MIKKLVVRTARRYPHYEEFVYENITEQLKDIICNTVFEQMDKHIIEDYQIKITK